MKKAIRAIKKLSSISLTLCMVLTLVPAPIPARAEDSTVQPGEIVITSQPVAQLTGVYPGESPGTLTAEAYATNGEPVQYQWCQRAWGSTISYRWGASGDYTLFALMKPGEYHYWCEIKAEGCTTVTSSETTVMIGSGTWDHLPADTIYVKANTSTTGIDYELPGLPFNDMAYTVSGCAISLDPLIQGQPQTDARTDYDQWNYPIRSWHTTFDTVAQPAGTWEMITYAAKDDLNFYSDIVFSLTVVAVDKIPVTISGITGAGEVIYSGNGQKGYEGTPKAAGYTGDFDYKYTGREGTIYDSEEMPADAGDYTVTISVPGENEDYTGSVAVDFSIVKKEVTVNNSVWYIGRMDDMPEITESDVWYKGFVGGDSADNCLSVRAVPRIPVSDTATPGTYDITYQPQAQLNDRGNKNYTLTHQNGSLTIDQYSNEAKVLSINLPLAVINSSGYASITGTVGKGVSSLTLSAVVSEGAFWALYQDEALTQEIVNKTVSLAAGDNIVYLKVTAESGLSSRYYKVTITREAGSTTPDPGATPVPATTPDPGTPLTPTTTPDLGPSPTPTVVPVDDGELLQTELNQTTLSLGQKTLYTGGNTGKETSVQLTLPEGLRGLGKEDTLYPVITYTSSDPKIASVTAAGRVKAVKAGKATITATVRAGGAVKILKATVTVKKAYIKLVKEKKQLATGERYTYKAIGYGITGDKITWRTTKKSVVVIAKKTGKAVAKSSGTDVVIAEYGSIRKKIKVTVTK